MRIDSALHNSKFPDLEVRHIEGKGKGLFARSSIPSSTLVCVGRPTEILPDRTAHSFQVDWNHHVELDEPARLINHGCDFNLAIRSNEFGGYSFWTVRDISLGEELCWHYGMTEATSIAVNQCCCGSDLCQGRSVGVYGVVSSRAEKTSAEWCRWISFQLVSRSCPTVRHFSDVRG